VAIGQAGAINAAILAAQQLSIYDKDIYKMLELRRDKKRQEVLSEGELI